MVKQLLANACDIELTDSCGWTAIHIASGHNDIDIVKYLVINGASINISDQDGNKPIAWAKNFNATDVFKYLSYVTKLQQKKETLTINENES
jgi:ankyrin repeat protein